MKFAALLTTLATLTLFFNNCGKNVPATQIASEEGVQAESLGSITSINYSSVGKIINEDGTALPNLTLEFNALNNGNAEITIYGEDDPATGYIKSCYKKANLAKEDIDRLVDLVKGQEYAAGDPTGASDEDLAKLAQAGSIKINQDLENKKVYYLENLSQSSDQNYFVGEEAREQIHQQYSEVFQKIRDDATIVENCIESNQN